MDDRKFFRDIFDLVIKIPSGQVMSYGQVGERVGCSARTVGWAMANVDKDVPWQRVVGADGYLRIGRRSAALMEAQRKLLRLEGVEFLENGCVNMARHQVDAAAAAAINQAYEEIGSGSKLKIYDISIVTSPETVTWDGTEPGFTLNWSAEISDICPVNISIVTIGAHTGTHLDAPLHFVAGGGTVAEIDINILAGPAEVVEIYGVKEITAADLDEAHIPEGTARLVLKTDNSARRLLTHDRFHRDYAAVAPSGARWLVDHGVKLVGIDYLSIGPYGDLGIETHQIVLGAGIIIVETLNLTEVPAGSYILAALPPRLKHSEASPCRAILMQEENH